MMGVLERFLRATWSTARPFISTSPRDRTHTYTQYCAIDILLLAAYTVGIEEVKDYPAVEFTHFNIHLLISQNNQPG